MNELAARSVAAIVLLVAISTVASGAWWLLAILALGFALRVAWGPRFSPAGLLATKVIAPRLGKPRWVPGPPKRFAQAIGLAVTGAGAIAWLVGADTVALVATLVIIVAAGLESIAGFCLGCWMLARLMNLGIIPESICERCAPGNLDA